MHFMILFDYNRPYFASLNNDQQKQNKNKIVIQIETK